jgi:16S rRNA G966 N2-methylase RsmD
VRVSHEDGDERAAVYDRQLLLFGARREAVLDLEEVRRYGSDSYGDADHVSVYGMAPGDWYDRGIRLMGRTAVECTVDALADAIATDVAALAASAPSTSDTLVVDPFAGSGNTLFWIQRRVPGSSGVGFELDAGVFRVTQSNLALLNTPIEVANLDCAAGLAGVTASSDQLVIVFLAPPWGDAFDLVSGLDLRRTRPPVAETVDLLVHRFPDTPLLFAIQVFERVDQDSLSELEARCDWSALHVYYLNAPGKSPGVLLGTRGWAPP